MISNERVGINKYGPFTKYYPTNIRYTCKCCFFPSRNSSFKIFQKNHWPCHDYCIFFDVVAMHLFFGPFLFWSGSFTKRNDFSLYILDYYYGHTVFALFYTFKKRLAKKYDVICYLGYYHRFTSFFKCSHHSNIPAEYTAFWPDRGLMYGNISISCSFSPAAPTPADHSPSGSLLHHNHICLFYRKAFKYNICLPF